MGLFDVFNKGKSAAPVRAALDEANDPGSDQGKINQLVEKILSVGLDGVGPYPSATKTAADALASAKGDTAQAINKITRRHVVGGGVGGIVTGMGGFVTMPIALPANVFEFYVQAARMVGAIATIRGYDVKQPNIRAAVLLTMVGSHSDEVLAKAGLATGGGRLANMAVGRLPRSAVMMINKAVGFRLLRTLGEGTFSRLGRAVPVVGGAVGGALDGYMMHRIADQAFKEFPKKA